MFSCGLLHIDTSMLADQQKLTYISGVRTLDAALRIYLEPWLIGTDDENDSRYFMLSAQSDDDDDDDDIYSY